MKRRSFLQGVAAAVSALFVPAVAARAAEKLIDPGNLSEAALEDFIIEINETGKRIAFEPKFIWLSPTGVVEYDGVSYKSISEAMGAT